MIVASIPLLICEISSNETIGKKGEILIFFLVFILLCWQAFEYYLVYKMLSNNSVFSSVHYIYIYIYI